MLRSLYPFQKTHPTSISFGAGDLFVELSGAANDKNWYFVAAAATGEAGYIPRNYVVTEKSSPEELLQQLDSVRDKIRVRRIADKERGELLANLDGVRKRVKAESTPVSTAAPTKQSTIPVPSTTTTTTATVSPTVLTSPFSVSPRSSSNSSGRSTPPTSTATTATNSSTKSATKKRVAPRPPTAPETNNTQPEKNPALPPKTRPPSTSTIDSGNPSRRASVTEPTSEQLRSHARDLVELVRVETGLSHSNSQSVVHTVLQYVCTHLHRLDKYVPAILSELEFPVLSDIADIAASADTKQMERLFEQLTQCKEDDQQRNWMLFEDESTIRNLLQTLSDCLTSADRKVSCYVLAKFKYFYVHNLIEYFQMETRWSIRKLLIEDFMIMCSLERVIISLMLSSVLPLELAQDLFQNMGDIKRLRMCALMLTVILSQGQPMPVHYFEQLGANFVNFLLDTIESGNDSFDHHRSHVSDDLVDAFVGLTLAYNLQFADVRTNVLVSCLASRPSAKTWTEKVLLLLNREEDPCAIVGRNVDGLEGTCQSCQVPHSVQKVILDMFTHETCHQLFYTNDIYVLIDIIVRQLADLSPENPKRSVYIRMCRLVLLHADYSEHLHRFKDFEIIFIRILDDFEEREEDKKVIEDICREVVAFNSLAP